MMIRNIYLKNFKLILIFIEITSKLRSDAHIAVLPRNEFRGSILRFSDILVIRENRIAEVTRLTEKQMKMRSTPQRADEVNQSRRTATIVRVSEIDL